MSIAVVTMVRNEADRYLRSALTVWGSFADEIIAYDDDSTDSTYSMLFTHGPKVKPTFPVDEGTGQRRRLNDGGAWGNEALRREWLWRRAQESTCDWLLWLDADMIPARDPRELEARDVDAIAFRLYDLWHSDARGRLWYRADAQWQAHNAPRTWMVRNPRQPRGEWRWNDRGLHCGHLPLDLAPRRTLVAPREYSLLHYGYLRDLDKTAKRHAYCNAASHLTPGEYAHAASITDDTYVAFPLPMEPQWHLEHALGSSLAAAPALTS